jgi:hypothetical protein
MMLKLYEFKQKEINVEKILAKLTGHIRANSAGMPAWKWINQKPKLLKTCQVHTEYRTNYQTSSLIPGCRLFLKDY